jgi:hypothetical protein
MSSNPKQPEERPDHAEAARHVGEAHHLLKRLRDRFDEENPELDLAITKLETALNILTIKTGGLL